MSKNKVTRTSDIYVQSERKHMGTGNSEYSYNIFFYGNFEICEASAEDLEELITVMQSALNDTRQPKGGIQ